MTPEVAQAIEGIRATFPAATVAVTEDGNGGAFVIIESVEPGDIYQQQTTWIGFQVTFQYPYADVYPHFMQGDLARADGQGLGEGMSTTTWQGRSAIQISRRSNRLNPVTDTAAVKVLKVIEWLRNR